MANSLSFAPAFSIKNQPQNQNVCWELSGRGKSSDGQGKDLQHWKFKVPIFGSKSAKECFQCKGTGVNSIYHFNGQFKAGELCWLCRGKREMLCWNCNGAGFIGGFMSTPDE